MAGAMQPRAGRPAAPAAARRGAGRLCLGAAALAVALGGAVVWTGAGGIESPVVACWRVGGASGASGVARAGAASEVSQAPEVPARLAPPPRGAVLPVALARPPAAAAAPLARGAAAAAGAPDGSGARPAGAAGSGPAAPPDGAPSPPVREDECYAALLARAAGHGADALVAAAEDVLRRPGPAAEAVAALRALRAAAAPQTERLMLAAFATRDALDGPHGVSVPAFVLRDLERRAAGDAAARAALRAVATGEIVAPEPRLRRRAASRLARVGDADDLLALAASLRSDDDELLLLGVAAALEHNPRAAGARAAFAGVLPRSDGEGAPGGR